jgi:hypothetical protein
MLGLLSNRYHPDFINRRKKDYVGAMLIINGTDDDNLIAIFQKALGLVVTCVVDSQYSRI